MTIATPEQTARELAQKLINDSSRVAGYRNSKWLDETFKHALTNRISTALEATAKERDERAEEKMDEELRRWQDGIRNHLIKVSGASDNQIDGAGCDSGDPLDFSLAEISQAFNHVFDEHEAAILATAKSAREDERERCATVADSWARSPSCLEEHTDDPCCHVRTGAGIADAIRKLK